MATDDASRVHRATGSATTEDRTLHTRLLGRDPTAPSDLAFQFLEPLIAWLRRTFRHLDEAMLDSIAIDLILSVGERPAQYNPDRLPLLAYLQMAARRDILNALGREQRRAARHAPLAAVELRPHARNSAWTGSLDPADEVLRADEGARLTSMRASFDDREWAVVQLLIDGERRTEAFAAVLGIVDRPEAEQKRDVKRAKDRVKKRFQRHWPRSTDDDA